MLPQGACREMVLTLAGGLALVCAHAQTNAPKGGVPRLQEQQGDARGAQGALPQFEVASIKTHKQEGMRMRVGFRLTPDGVSMYGVPLSSLVAQAFRLPDSRILNEPTWTNAKRYDIEAKVDPAEAPQLKNLTTTQRMAMLLPLLEDRFGLKFHHETKLMEVYALVVDKGGPKLQPVNPDDNPGKIAANAERNGRKPNDSPSAPVSGNLATGEPNGAGKPGDGDGPTKPPQGAMMMQMSTQGMTLHASEATTTQLAELIQRALDSTVVDKTGLTGKYDYTLNFAPEMGRGPMGGMPPPVPPSSGGSSSRASSQGDDASSPPATAPSIFTAVREQLGLRLQAKKEPVDVIVIDHIQQPSPN